MTAKIPKMKKKKKNMIDNDKLCELTCYFHTVPKGEEYKSFQEDGLKEIPNSVINILSNEKNNKITKCVIHSQVYWLILETDKNLNAWKVDSDFNLESAKHFIEEWDKKFPLDNKNSLFEYLFTENAEENINKLRRKN